MTGTQTTIDLKENDIYEIPESVFSNKKANWIILSNNNIRIIPGKLGELKEITRLAFNDNKIYKVENGLGHLSNLSWMDFTRNRLRELPEDISSAKNLTGLGLSENLFEDIPECIYKLYNLRKFGCFSNRIKNISPKIANLSFLVKMDLSNNRLEHLPEEICELRNLTWLNLSSNQLKQIPKNINRLKNLEELGLGINQLEELPNLAGLDKLRILPVFKNRLKKINGLQYLTALEKLDCSDNRFEEFPNEVLVLKNLKYFNLRSNRLKIINFEPIYPELVSSINMIDVSDNFLSNIPLKFFKTFSNLSTIRFSGNPFLMDEPEIPNRKPNLYQAAFSKALNLKGLKRKFWPIETHIKDRYTCDECKEVFADIPYGGFALSSLGDGYTFVIKRYLCSMRCVKKQSDEK